MTPKTRHFWQAALANSAPGSLRRPPAGSGIAGSGIAGQVEQVFRDRVARSTRGEPALEQRPSEAVPVADALNRATLEQSIGLIEFAASLRHEGSRDVDEQTMVDTFLQSAVCLGLQDLQRTAQPELIILASLGETPLTPGPRKKWWQR